MYFQELSIEVEADEFPYFLCVRSNNAFHYVETCRGDWTSHNGTNESKNSTLLFSGKNTPQQNSRPAISGRPREQSGEKDCESFYRQPPPPMARGSFPPSPLSVSSFHVGGRVDDAMRRRPIVVYRRIPLVRSFTFYVHA